MNKLIVAVFTLIPVLALSQINGPMVGYVDHMEAHVWAQCPKAQSMTIAYTIDGGSVLTQRVELDPVDAGCHTYVLRDLIPNTTYSYALTAVNGSDTLTTTRYQFKTEGLVLFRDSLPDLRITLGSCSYFNEQAHDRPGKSYGVENNIYETMADQDPDLTLWLGDNLYLREPDWGSASGYNYRYTQTRSRPELQRLLRTGKHYAIWDDHDFGPNDAIGSWYNAEIAKASFQRFWANPGYGAPGLSRSIYTQLDHADIGFFLLDNRTYREPAGDNAEMLGKKQMAQLLNALESSKYSFNFVLVGGQVLNTAKKYENHANFRAERARLLAEIEERDIKNVIFLTGDRHHTAMSMIENERGNLIYDLTVSPLTSKAYEPKEKNDNFVKGTLVSTQNFGVLDISGAPGSRTLRIQIMNPEGKVFWEKSIEQQ